MNKSQKIIKGIEWLISKNPKALDTNTGVCLALWDKIFEQRGIPPLTQAQRAAITEYGPELITRVRRKYKKGTEAQYVEEIEYRQEFTTKHTNTPLHESN